MLGRKNTGHRDECHGGLLFPPEQCERCTLSQKNASEIFAVRHRVRTQIGLIEASTAVIGILSQYRRLWDDSQDPPRLTCRNRVNLEEVSTQRRRSRHAAYHQYFVARDREAACANGRFRQLYQPLEVGTFLVH